MCVSVRLFLFFWRCFPQFKYLLCCFVIGLVYLPVYVHEMIDELVLLFAYINYLLCEYVLCMFVCYSDLFFVLNVPQTKKTHLKVKKNESLFIAIRCDAEILSNKQSNTPKKVHREKTSEHTI